jgi:ubiquinone/menaquinone biosynthesis C-methylase UbiE
MLMDPAARRTFLEQYAVIRRAEGRGSNDPAYYRALPFGDLSGRNTDQWEVRSRSYRHFERTILQDLEREAQRPLRILDLGAGNGWMSNRLRQRGHHPVAIDIFTDSLDGLGALRHYEPRPDALAAEFNVLPFRDHSIDIAIFNSSFHYSSDYRRTLTEVRRCLRPQGCFIVIDSPVYEQASHGEQMRAERQEFFARTYGFRSESLGSIEYLDEALLASLGSELSIDWRRSYPWYGWHWALRPWQARRKGRRPPSRFFILVGRFR